MGRDTINEGPGGSVSDLMVIGGLSLTWRQVRSFSGGSPLAGFRFSNLGM
jgi:hypothetical protein